MADLEKEVQGKLDLEEKIEEKGDSGDKEEKEQGNWLPLESNPSVLNDFAKRMGLDLAQAKFCDVWGLDDELLAFIPKPVHACVLLFPSVESIAAFKKKQAEQLKKDGQKLSEKLFYITQHDDIGNACGTIACLHALSNCHISGKVKLLDKSPLLGFMKDTSAATAHERGYSLLESKGIQEVSEAAADNEDNQTKTPARDDRVNAHFIAFVEVDGDLCEMDGRKIAPINHGKTSADTFIKDVAGVVKKNFISLEPDNPNFVLIALSKTPKD